MRGSRVYRLVLLLRSDYNKCKIEMRIYCCGCCCVFVSDIVMIRKQNDDEDI